MTLTPGAPVGTTVVLLRWTACTPEAVSRARTALRHVLAQLGCDGDAISDAVLAASELVANATEHAVGPYELRLRRTAAELLCEVQDADPRIPEIAAFPAVAPFEPDPAARGGGLDALLEVLTERGRGMRIVDELTCGAWGFRRDCDGGGAG
ncbi:ATP-binding protein [Streptomyces sp. NBC_00257]|uniref:ATP-binding protein n=1 Tax=unclassified Streptomyces TaxID=2593676 RepID=UPI0022515AD4|nr:MULTISPECIES: ATP-binding protein [unclassified Streptomyces]MCX5431579.1 ATP-binding protein [Streptomyces sp. NBC_00062]